MSNSKNIARIAADIAEMEAALEATRQTYAAISTETIEAKINAFAEVVRNTHRKMARPAGFEWAFNHSFKVVAITSTHLKVEATKRWTTTERIMFDIPRSDLSLSTWQVTSIIRRLSAQRFLVDLNTTVGEKQDAVTSNRKELAAAQERLQQSEHALTEAIEARDRREARDQRIEAKRQATRAHRKNAPAPEVAPEVATVA